MADSIVRLRVDTKDYDANIKTARQGLLQMEQACRKVGGTFEYVEKAELEYVRALGQMETKSQSVKGKIGELTAAYTDLRAEYNRMTDAEKSSEFGKALNASLEQMKGRIADNRQEFQNISGEIGNTSGVLDKLSSAFGVNIGQLTKFGGLVGVATTALGVAKDAFFASEANVDAWQSTVESAESVYTSFLTAINNGDISGFLSRIDQIVQAAREAYNELDTLGTMRTVQSPQTSAQQTENERLRMMIQTRRYIAPTDGRKASMRNGQLLTDAQVKRIEQMLQGGMRKIVVLNQNEIKQTNRAINALYNKAAQENGMSQREFRKGVSSWAEFSKNMEGYKKYIEWNNQAATKFAKQGGRGFVDFDKNNPYVKYKKWGTFAVDNENGTYHQLVGLIKQRDQQMGQTYAQQAQGYRAINRAEGITTRGTRGSGHSGGGAGGGDTEADRAAEQVKKAQQDVADTITKWKAGLIKNEDYDKAMQQAQSKLADAYLNAANVTGNAKYTQGFKDAAEKASSLAAGIDYENEQQKEAAEAARKLKAAQEKLAAAQEEAANAQKSGDLGAFYQAQKKIKAAGGTVVPVNAGDFSATTANISAYIAHLKEEISKSDIGSDLYNKLTENLADANAFSGVISEMVKNGVQLADIDPQALGKRILSGENIEDMDWETIQDALNEKFKEMEVDPIKINLNTGDISKDEEGDDKEWDKFKDKYGKLTSGLSQVASGLQQVGIKIPDEITRVISVMQGIMTVIQGVETVISIFSSSTQTANTVAVGLNTAALAANTAALATNSVSNFLPFANGGIVGRAAGGMLIPGNSKSGDRLRMPVSSGGFIGVNSGELILNAAQQNNLANGLQGAAGLRNLQLSAVIHGEDIMLVLDNVEERRGDGEYITAKFA